MTMGADDEPERQKEKKKEKKNKKKKTRRSDGAESGEKKKKEKKKRKSEKKERGAAAASDDGDVPEGSERKKGGPEWGDRDFEEEGGEVGRTADKDDESDAEVADERVGGNGDGARDAERDDEKEGGDKDGADKQQHEEEEQQQSSSAKRKRKRKRKKKDSAGGSVGTGGGGSDVAGQEEKLTSMDHTVYVEGIPFDCSEDDVRAFFEENGCGDVLQMRLPRWQDSGRLRGYGHIVFDTVASRTRALKELTGLNLGRRYLTIREPNAPRPGTTAAAASGGVQPRSQPEGSRTVFVKNLPYESSEDDLSNAFRPCGRIVDGGVRLARNYVTKQCKGFAYVEFKNPEGAYAAVQRAAKPFGLAVRGRPCFVDYDEGKMKGSYRTAEGKLWQREHGSVYSTGGK